jgi:hypothetical protein
MNAVTRQPSLAPAALNSIAPVPRERCARSRRNCVASPPLIDGGAARRIESLSAVALPDWVRRAAGKDGAGFPSRSHKRPAARAEAGVERSHAMRRCKSDPRWITVRFEGYCVRFKRPIRPGKRAFCYPEDRSLYCEAEDCRKAASPEFSARAFDEEHNASM